MREQEGPHGKMGDTEGRVGQLRKLGDINQSAAAG